jgi:hypothetical protein
MTSERADSTTRKYSVTSVSLLAVALTKQRQIVVTEGASWWRCARW